METRTPSPRSRRRSRIAAGLFAALLATVAFTGAGCGGGDDKSAEGGSTETTAAAGEKSTGSVDISKLGPDNVKATAETLGKLPEGYQGAQNAELAGKVQAFFDSKMPSGQKAPTIDAANVSKDGQPVATIITVTFTMKEEPAFIQAFFDSFGAKNGKTTSLGSFDALTATDDDGFAVMFPVGDTAVIIGGKDEAAVTTFAKAYAAGIGGGSGSSGETTTAPAAS